MNLRKLLILILFAAFAGSIARAQNTNPAASDTSKTRKDSIAYGPSTTIYFYEAEVYQNLYRRYRVDTAITNLHRYNVLQRNLNMYQDLGNLGTAIRPIYYQVPRQIGTALGYTAYDAYLLDPQNFKYFDTFSPFTELSYVQGGKGRTMLKARLARNITPDWNVGVVYQRFGANKILGRSTRRNDPHTTHQTFGIHTSFFNRSHRYKLLANFTNYDQSVAENGGLLVHDTINELRELFVPRDWLAQLEYRLDKVSTNQSRNHAHLYHQFGILDTVRFQLFHSIDWSEQKNSYKDENIRSNFNRGTGFRSVYDSVLFDSTKVTTARHASVYRLLDNKAGLKGRIGKFSYIGYLRMRNYYLDMTFIQQGGMLTTSERRNIPDEYFAGGSMRYRVNDSTRIDVETEYLLGNSQQGRRQRADYRLKAELGYRFIYAGHERVFYRPDLIRQKFYGNFMKWDFTGAFDNTLTDHTYGGLRLDLPYARVNPYVSFTNVKNYIYYDTDAHPRQSTRDVRILQVGLNAQADWNKWHNQTNLLYSRNLGVPLIPMPAMLVNTQFYYEDNFFKSALLGQIGVDISWKSPYYGMAYMPVSQQFYLQTDYKVENYVFMDVFFNFRIRRAMLFMKMTNVLQDIVAKGYFATPRYLQQPRSIEFGINWLMFD